MYGGLSTTASSDRTNTASRTRSKKSARLCTTRSNPARRIRRPASPSYTNGAHNFFFAYPFRSSTPNSDAHARSDVAHSSSARDIAPSAAPYRPNAPARATTVVVSRRRSRRARALERRAGRPRARRAAAASLARLRLARFFAAARDDADDATSRGIECGRTLRVVHATTRARRERRARDRGVARDAWRARARRARSRRRARGASDANSGRRAPIRFERDARVTAPARARARSVTREATTRTTARRGARGARTEARARADEGRRAGSRRAASSG